MVSYPAVRGHGVPGPRRPHPTGAPRCPVRPGRPDAGRPDRTARHHQDRRRQAPGCARGRRAGGEPAPGPREAALPQPGPDPARPRPLGEQVHRAVGRRPGRSQGGAGAAMEKVFEIYIRTTPEHLWAAITDPAIRAKYHFGAASSRLDTGSSYDLVHPGATGRSSRARTSSSSRRSGWSRRMHTLWSEDAEREGTSRVTWEIEPIGDSCRLTVTHDQLRDAPRRSSTAAGRWCCPVSRPGSRPARP